MSAPPSDPADALRPRQHPSRHRRHLCAGSLRGRDTTADPPAPALRSVHPPVPDRGRHHGRDEVLDVGSGAGNVALLLAELAGPQGKVVGADTNAEILEMARARVRAAGWTTVVFHAGDVMRLELEGTVDAVIGRWVLQYTPDPAALLRHARRWLRPGGIVAFQEIDLSSPARAYPTGRCTTS